MSYLDDMADAIRGHVPQGALPDTDVAALFRLYAVLALAKGTAVTAQDVHNAWSAWMQTIDAAHSSIRPFGELDAATQAQDDAYVNAIHAAVRDAAES